MRDLDGTYFLNADGNIIAHPESFNASGTPFEYQRHNGGIEYLSADGPLMEPLVFEVSTVIDIA